MKSFNQLKIDNIRFSISLLGVAQICSWGTLFYSFPQIASALTDEYGWLKTETYGALTIALLCSALASIPVGHLIDKGHGKRVMTLGSIAAGVLFMVFSQINSIYWFYVILAGIGILHSATLYEAAFAVIANQYDTTETKKHITSLTIWGGFAGTVFIPLIEVLLEVIGWRNTLIVLGMINIIICASIYNTIPTYKKKLANNVLDKSDHKTTSRNVIKWTLTQPIFWSLLVSFSIFLGVTTAFKFHLYPILIEKNLTALEVVGIIAVLGPSQVAGRILFRMYSSKVTVDKLGIFTAAILPVVFIVYAYLQPNYIFLVLFAIAFGAATGTMTIIKGIVIPELLTKQAYGVINGVMNMPVNTMKAVSPSIAAFLWYVTSDYSLFFNVLIISSIVAILSFYFLTSFSVSPLK